MTDLVEMRRLFEEWFDAPTRLVRSGDGYVFMVAQSAWDTWKAAFEAGQTAAYASGRADQHADDLARITELEADAQRYRTKKAIDRKKLCESGKILESDLPFVCAAFDMSYDAAIDAHIAAMKA